MCFINFNLIKSEENWANKVDSEDLRRLNNSGRIAETILAKARRRLRSVVSKLQLCEKIEDTIRKMAAIPAFPVNISVNEQAAHYTSPPFDKSVLPSVGVAKLDIGVTVEGWLVDTAVSLNIRF